MAVLLVWQPWVGIEPSFRGIKMGADIAGGSQMVFELEASRVTVQVNSEDRENLINDMLTALEINLETSTQLVSYESTSGQAVFDVGRYLTKPIVQKALEDLGTVVSVETHLEDSDMTQAISSLKVRIDPYDVAGTQIRSFDKNSIIFEASGMAPSRVRDMLGKQGKFEVIIDNQIVLGNEEIESVTNAIAVESAAYAPINLTKSGTEMLKLASSGKANHAIVVYLDRPSDAILVFDNDIMKNTNELSYYGRAKKFYVSRETSFASYFFYISVSAVPVIDGSISQASQDYLSNQVSDKAKVVLLGTQTDFSSEVVQEISANYKINTVPRRDGERVDDWVLRACGVQSAPLITQTMAAGGVTSDLSFPFVEKSSTLSLSKAQSFQKAILNSLNFPISFEYETSIAPSFGTGFKNEIMVAGGVVVLWAFAMMYLAFSRIKVVLTILVFALVDAILTLGAISVFSLTFGLPAIAGLLLVVLAGLNQHIIITNELLKGVQPQEKASVGWRTSRALSISYLATFTTILVSALIAFLGFGPIRIFAIVAAVGMLIAMFLTRPVFAKVIESALTGSPRIAFPFSVAKPQQNKQ
ncbi:MAG: hypothetical protein ABH852_00025 [Methanobacteriota archaeon]